MARVVPGNSTDGRPDAKAVDLSMAQIQEVLKSIFEYYSTAGTAAMREGRLTSARFQRMALDANLVDENLTSAKVDLIFSRLCGTSAPYMTMDQFLDANVRIAATKYPSLDRQAAVQRLFHEHFASFSGSVSAIFDDLDDPSLLMLSQAKSSLQVLYEGYFQWECRAINGKRHSSTRGESQASLIALLNDFEVLPDLAPKSTAFAVFREAARAHEVPQLVRDRLGGDEAQLLGRQFTFVHFAAALALMAKKCFADDDGCSALKRLFEWMDNSKGRATFLARHPGQVTGGASAIRLLPDSLGKDAGAKQKRGSYAAVAATSSTAAADMTVDEGSRRESVTTLATPVGARRLVQQLFGHYAALGDPLNRTQLSSMKFNRFLRDCGLVAVEVQSAPSFEFVPTERARSSSTSRLSVQSGQTGHMTRSGSSSALRRSTLPTSPSFTEAPLGGGAVEKRRSFAVSSSKAAAAGTDLPLRPFPFPPMTHVEADLIFVQAMTIGPGSSQEATKRSSARSHSRRNLNQDGFWRALVDVSVRCFPGLGAPEKSAEALVDQVLAPLSHALLACHDGQVAEATKLLGQPETRDVFQTCLAGLDKIFQHYATYCGTSQVPTWAAESMSRFASDFELLSEVGHLPLQKIMRDCVHFESIGSSSSPDGQLTFSGFQLALIMLSQKMHGSSGTSSLTDLISFLNRLNSTAKIGNFVGPTSTTRDALIPGLPDLSAMKFAHKSTSRPSLSGGKSRLLDSRASVEMSWADLIKV
mmetsp:Transcript_42768/g.100258  ORF Transcript_42768/g.100258 Transcript_42768/m.100258 type:complete len:757 (-) Transcript_42768:114-2384(-)|eukprot:CAMPEP_0178441586 /NCGR_PEP_ID=MMETSP0689_2-20121128/37560_1 /TAXON_ID=160604 /ORGANISM="Amphidinium massartii, Strain CS-259" /LENGTH=756 /DNA_ID=CAMNT_0020064775 /DNA_START=61 /DNA_END=2331 /DNA_ORIENTATION=+